MRKVAVISDVHAFAGELVLVLEQIDEAKIDDVFCLGDFASGGPYPLACYEMITRRCSLVLAGNHERMIVEKFWEHSTSEYARWARMASRELGDERVLAIASLPSRVDGKHMQLCHASLRDPVWDFISSAKDAKAQFPLMSSGSLLFGHTHAPALWGRDEHSEARRIPISKKWQTLPRQALLNPGAVSGSNGLRWMEIELDDNNRPARVRWHRAKHR